MNSSLEQFELLPSNAAGKCSIPKQTALQPYHEFGSESVHNDALEHKQEIGTENVPAETRIVEPGHIVSEQSGGPPEVSTSAAGSDHIFIEQFGPIPEDLTKISSCEQLRSAPEDANMNSSLEQFELLPSDATGKCSIPKQTALQPDHEFGSESVHNEPLEHKQEIDTENVPAETRIVEPGHIGSDQSGGPPEVSTSAADSDHIFLERFIPIPEDLTKISSCERLRSAQEDANMNSSLEQIELLPGESGDAIGKLSPKETTLHQDHDLGSESVHKKPLEHKQEIGTENAPSKTRVELGHIGSEQSGGPPKVSAKNSILGQLRASSEDEIMKCSLEQLGLPTEDVAINSNLEQLGPLLDDVTKNPGLEQLGPSQNDAFDDPHHSGYRDKSTTARSRKRKYTLRSSVECTRVLCSRSQEKSKAPEHGDIVAEHGADEEKSRRMMGGRKKKHTKNIPVDEFSRIRKNLTYLLARMSYEQNLIDAYSGEGWKGQSLEKVKPEKQLERAKSEIFRCKLKIRDLFQRLDLSCGEGRLPESLFDSERQIDSEDIFCAKCGSSDFSPDNDIILCEGACDRGFHQYCLEPPLLKEDVPPIDEGWLCPGCDSKVDCLDLLNESYGTNLSITDSWEKVFPEAAAAGNKLGDGFGFPSDDSQDDDYNPDGPEVDGGVLEDESSSDEADSFSASDEFESSLNLKQYLGLPSSDSEDDDFDPNALDLDEQIKQESSSSDFTSDSEDFSVAFDDNRSSGRNGGPILSFSYHLRPSGGSDGEISKLGGRKKQSLNDELLSLLDSDCGQGDPKSVFGERNLERLDYKKLHDETYGDVTSDSRDEDWTYDDVSSDSSNEDWTCGDVSSDSSDEDWTYGEVSSDSSDEDWMDTTIPKKRKRHTGEVVVASPNGRTPASNSGTNAKDMKQDQKKGELTPRGKARKKLDVEGTNNLPAKSRKVSKSSSSTAGSAYKRLGETVSQSLLKSFKENQYPERATKENLAKELGITLQQVSKWFENARWSFRHSSQMELNTAASSTNKSTRSPQINKNPPEPAPKMSTRNAACNGAENKQLPKTSPAAIECGSGDATLRNLSTSREKSSTPKSRKRKGVLDQASDHILSVEETLKQSAQVDSPKAGTTKTWPTRTKRRKSVS